jgi:RNA-directed DNA polymerase
LEIAWKRVKANRGSGGVDGESIEAFGEKLEERLDQMHAELRGDTFRPQPVRQKRIPKAGKPEELGIYCGELHRPEVTARGSYDVQG